MRRQYKLIIAVLILFLSIGFAYLTANLNINGTVTFRDNIWDVHLENIEVESGSTDVDTTTINNDEDTVNFTVSLTRPGDYYEFYVDVVNDGTMDATLDSTYKTTLTGDYLTNLNYAVTYYSNRELTEGDLLRAGCKERIKVRLEYEYDVNSYTQLNDISLYFRVNYKKTDIQDSTYNAKVWNFDSKAEEDTFIVPKTGTYKLEVWGAQGGSAYNSNGDLYAGGYGGYSVGNISLTKDSNIYINVGGQGDYTRMDYLFSVNGGYNGGGSARYNYDKTHSYNGSGGGATHIAASTGVLSELENKKSDIYIVAGGGGGSVYWTGYDVSQYGLGGSGGGYIGNNGSRTHGHQIGLGGNQTSGGTGGSNLNGTAESGSFGVGGAGNFTNVAGTGGGSGYYGGGGSVDNAGAGGGSGYIGNTNLTDKIMYCYNCQESTEEADETHIKTRSTTNVSETPTANYAKIGHGYARITFIS